MNCGFSGSSNLAVIETGEFALSQKNLGVHIGESGASENSETAIRESSAGSAK